MRRTQEAEQQYTWFCRVLERLTSENSETEQQSFRRFIEIAEQCPVYLWSTEKMKSCRAYHQEMPPPLSGLYNLEIPVIHSDPEGCAMVLDITPIVTGIRATGLAIYHMGSEVLGVDAVGMTMGAVELRTDPAHPKKYHSQAREVVGRVWDASSGKLDEEITDWINKAGGRAMGREFWEARSADLATHLRVAVEEYLYTIKPKQIVIRESPSKVRKVKKSRKGTYVPRLHEREIHRVIDPDEVIEIRKKSERDRGPGTGTHASPIPHIRRPHQRVLRAARYKEARGRVVKVEETWVGCDPGDTFVLPKCVYHVVSVGGKKK